MKKSNIVFTVIAAAAVIALGFYLWPAEQPVPEPATVETPAPDTARPAQPSVPGPSVETADEAAPEPAPAEPVPPSPEEVTASGEKPILGHSIRVREIRADGAIRNLEIVFRPGILPKKLFNDNRNVVLNYDQLHINSVGTGAATAFFYYEVVTADTNGDGYLTGADRKQVALSRPDASQYTVLVANVDEVLEYEHLNIENALQLVLRFGDRIERRVYSLDTFALEHEEMLEGY